MATTIRNQKLFCLNCGESRAINYPIAVDKFNTMATAFEKKHKNCPKTWVEPQADLTKSIQERADWWSEYGETGMSSITMLKCFMGYPKSQMNHPQDPDDFSRCYKLLQAIPEWKEQLDKLKHISKEWNNLVCHWNKLTEMYERNVKEDWKNYKEIGMYEFMQDILKSNKM